MANINEIIKAAMDLGITLTNAEIGTELCNAWRIGLRSPRCTSTAAI